SGTDTQAYVDLFNQMKYSIDFESTWEIFYKYLAYFLSLMTDSRGFIFFNVLLQLFLISYIARKLEVRNIPLVLLAYISFLPGFDLLTNGLRQGISNGIALIIFMLWLNRKKIGKFAVILIPLLHKSILTYIPFFIL